MTRANAWLVVGAAAIIGVVAGVFSKRAKSPPTPTRGGFSYGGDSTTKLDRDPAHLVPGFARRLEIVFQAMRARGFDPVLWEGRRSPERAKQLAKQKVGIVLSTHLLGLGADVVDRKLRWGAPTIFWKALGEEGERAGLYWGGRFTDPDLDHLQAIHWRDEKKVFAMTPDEIARYVA